MFDKQARFWVGEFDGEKECAADNEVSAITRHRIFVCGLGCWRRSGLLFEVLTLLELMFSDDIGGRLKALASTKLKVEMANRQSSNRVRAYAHTLVCSNQRTIATKQASRLGTHPRITPAS